MKFVKWIIALAVIGFLAALGVAYSTPYWFAVKHNETVDVLDPALIARGQYVAQAADCAACHTAPGGQPFTGGLAMQTPMGTIFSTNITPDRVTGIGAYDYGDFERAVRQGVRRDGTPLYPAMPYVSYAVVTNNDVKALYAYFMSAVKPVAQRDATSTIPWPMSLRWPLAWWQLMFAGPRHFVAPAGASAEVARGAYLVEGLEHCGACHTPRGLAFQEEALRDGPGGRYLAGAVLEGWYAKSLRGDATGLGTWSQDDLVDFLKTGRTKATAAFGSMVDVINHSTQHLTDADDRAIAAYVKTLTPRPGHPGLPAPEPDATTATLLAGDYATAGSLAYVEYCAVCHRLDGRGMPRVFPALTGNSAVLAGNPDSLIQVTLAGSFMAHTPADRMTFAMPGFDQVSNQTLAELLSFVRGGWGNQGGAVTAGEVAAMRGLLAGKPTNFIPRNPVAGESR